MILQVNDLWKIYGAGETLVNALRGASLSVNKGDFIALVGPSGSGKSTLLHLLGAMDKPSRGDVLLEGNHLGTLKESQLTDLRLRRIGFIFQTFNLIPTLTAQENIALPAKLAGVSGRAANERAVTLLRQVGLVDRVNHYPSQMSGGQKQRVAIARALVNDPALILADEPTGNLDSVAGNNIVELLQELNDTGRTIMMVTHNNELAQRANRILQMKDGQISELIHAAVAAG